VRWWIAILLCLATTINHIDRQSLSLAPPLVGLLIHYWGWQAAFLIPGAAGLLWAILWRRYYHLPENHPQISRDELELITGGRQQQAAEAARPAWHSFLRYREVWGLMLARFVSDGGYYFFTFWLPAYLSRERGFNVLKIALFSWIPFLAADLGTLGGGWTGKRLIERGVSLDRARKLVIWIGALVVLAAMPAVFAGSALAAMMLIAVAMFGIQFKSSSLFALPTDLFPSRDVATVWGLSGAAGSFGAMLFQPVIGFLADGFSYVPVFIAVPLMQILAALVISLLIRNTEPRL
jgi:ACS family hexuronate transporter-like MFS transporter